MSATTTGSCVVCGKETNTRCSSCSSAGTDWMYFCSRAHQKLVWPYHKEVCGEKGNPLLFPPLSDAEVDTAVKIAQRGAPFLEGTLRNVFEESLGSQANDLPFLIRTLSKEKAATYPAATCQDLLAGVRALCGQVAAAETAPTSDSYAVCMTVWQRTSAVSAFIKQSLNPPNAACPRPYLSRLNHHILLYKIATHLRGTAKLTGDTVKEREYHLYHYWTFRCLREFTERDIKPEYPKDAELISHCLLLQA